MLAIWDSCSRDWADAVADVVEDDADATADANGRCKWQMQQQMQMADVVKDKANVADAMQIGNVTSY